MRVPLTLVVAALATCVPVARGQEAPAGPPSIRLVFQDGTTVTQAMQRAAVAEAATLWRRYGVRVHADVGSCDMTLTVGITAASRADLGSVQFGPNGIPQPHISLHYAAVVDLATATAAYGIEAREWPVRLRDEVIARAVGRTLAHEIGHYLLRSPHHTRSGLMRSRQRAAALAAPNRDSFGLTEPEVARLRVVLAASPAQPCSTDVTRAAGAVPDSLD